MKWYHTNIDKGDVNCSFCVLDDEFSIITSTEYIAKLPQTVSCQFCGWCPKTDGLTRPADKRSGYVDKISLWNAPRGHFPDKTK